MVHGGHIEQVLCGRNVQPELHIRILLLLRSPSKPGVRVKKAIYKPGRNWGSITLTSYLYIPCSLHSTLRHRLVSSSHCYVIASSVPPPTTSLFRHRTKTNRYTYAMTT